MKNATFPFVLLFSLLCMGISLLFPSLLSAQSSTQHTDNAPFADTSVRAKLVLYTDSIRANIYKDNQLIEELIRRCDTLLAEHEDQIPKEDLLVYISQKAVYYTTNSRSLPNSFEILKKYESLLQDTSITQATKNGFLYVQTTAHMFFGDFTFAQKAAYELIDKGRTYNDTSAIIRGLYSIAQVLNKEEDFDRAIEYLEQILSLSKQYSESLPSSYPLIQLELINNYIKLERYDSALSMIEEGLQYSKDNDIGVLEVDFLFYKTKIALAKNDVSEARRIYRQAAPMAIENQDSLNIMLSITYRARILMHEKKIDEALKAYEQVIQLRGEALTDMMAIVYKEAHEACQKQGYYVKAYKYLMKSNEIRNTIQSEENKRQIAYLKIKYDTEQREKENQALSFKVRQQQVQTHQLYALLAYAVLFIICLFWAFQQKKQYNQSLKAKVEERTMDIEKANSQLKEQTAFIQKIIDSDPAVIHIFDLEKRKFFLPTEAPILF